MDERKAVVEIISSGGFNLRTVFDHYDEAESFLWSAYEAYRRTDNREPVTFAIRDEWEID